MRDLPGAEDRYEDVRSKIYKSLEPQLITKRENDILTRFATKHVSRNILQDENLRSYYRCLNSGADYIDGGLGIDENEFVRRVLERRLQPFIATLIFSNAAIAAARAFVVNVVAKPDDIGNKLPLKQARLEQIFPGDSATIYNFLSHQHRFCTLTLFRDGAWMMLDEDDAARLPYIREREIGKGGFGSVWEVEIPYGHFVIHTSGETSFPHGSKVVARKDYRRGNHARQDFENERDLCKAILGSPNRCDNVLLSYGTIEYSSGSAFSLFMPKAEFDLHKYMKHHESDDAHSMENMAKHMLCAAGLARGVAHLHNGIESPGGGTLVCYHMDVKPDNVLIFHKDGEMIWKISDFGLSRIKTLPDGSIRSTGHHLAVSPTRNLAGQGIYLAPESGSPRQMTRKSDVWSLGCIISVLCVWLQKGYSGVIEYSDSRIEAGDNSANFYSPRLFGLMKPNPQIKEWHNILIREEKDVVIKRVLVYILRYLEKNTFLIKALGRPEASELKQRLENAATKGLEMTRQVAHDWWPINPVLRRLSSIIIPPGTSSVRGWPISFPGQGQACQFSPDGAILSYYSSERSQISLYYGSDQFPTNTGDHLVEPTPVYSHSADIVDVGITKNYMVIAEKATSFRVRNNLSPWRLYLAKLEDVSLAHIENGELDENVWRHRDLPKWTNQDADNVTSLSFSSESSIWFTVKPAPGCRACVARCVWVENEPPKAIESVAFKGPTAEVVASFAPYHKSSKCIVATVGNCHTAKTAIAAARPNQEPIRV
ncbi:hypothetical protein O1611_g2184 [Lasiodiplodia mahajangana]|uniref:Uncharacterized protein n=1 Tax=Lasiodiplodia mahajangana TaxID=1108764 RepID=A0ACC2JVD6_9PEZI|nr:hypothetical protein O1611_g2184 [Lasiodiplodia mahajangana]